MQTTNATNTPGAPRVLLAEDHLALRQSLASLFEQAGYRIDFAADGRTALKLALNDPPDLLVLDVGLPGLSGLEVCARLRREADRHIPILMLTARDTLADKLLGFESGADDYLIKPFSGLELLARCQALAMRHRLGARHCLELGSLRIDRQLGSATRFGQRLELPRRPYQILLALAEAWPRALTRSQLVDKLWPDEAPPSDPLRSHLYVLRQALDKAFIDAPEANYPAARPMLITVHGVGFRLDAEA